MFITLKMFTRLCQPHLTIRSQKIGGFQDQSGLFMDLHGLSYTGQMAGSVMGTSKHPRTILNKKHSLNSQHQTLIGEKLAQMKPVS